MVKKTHKIIKKNKKSTFKNNRKNNKQNIKVTKRKNRRGASGGMKSIPTAITTPTACEPLNKRVLLENLAVFGFIHPDTNKLLLKNKINRLNYIIGGKVENTTNISDDIKYNEKGYYENYKETNRNVKIRDRKNKNNNKYNNKNESEYIIKYITKEEIDNIRKLKSYIDSNYLSYVDKINKIEKIKTLPDTSSINLEAGHMFINENNDAAPTEKDYNIKPPTTCDKCKLYLVIEENTDKTTIKALDLSKLFANSSDGDIVIKFFNKTGQNNSNKQIIEMPSLRGLYNMNNLTVQDIVNNQGKTIIVNKIEIIAKKQYNKIKNNDYVYDNFQSSNNSDEDEDANDTSNGSNDDSNDIINLIEKKFNIVPVNISLFFEVALQIGNLFINKNMTDNIYNESTECNDCNLYLTIDNLPNNESYIRALNLTALFNDNKINTYNFNKNGKNENNAFIINKPTNDKKYNIEEEWNKITKDIIISKIKYIGNSLTTKN